jgi:hypothetical protein
MAIVVVINVHGVRREGGEDFWGREISNGRGRVRSTSEVVVSAARTCISWCRDRGVKMSKNEGGRTTEGSSRVLGGWGEVSGEARRGITEAQGQTVDRRSTRGDLVAGSRTRAGEEQQESGGKLGRGIWGGGGISMAASDCHSGRGIAGSERRGGEARRRGRGEGAGPRRGLSSGWRW